MIVIDGKDERGNTRGSAVTIRVSFVFEKNFGSLEMTWADSPVESFAVYWYLLDVCSLADEVSNQLSVIMVWGKV